MEVVKIIVIVLECLASVALIAAVLFQSGKEAGLGALMGNNETFMSKGNADTLDKKLASATKWIALAWALLALILSLF
ncbi:MAG: preprotein translocase subunit SecG [Ruminococcaceae bacterium]|nr:preprotein translocase subunit SecG [Oscillospiraceae bacterium]